jgi:hypothetical protein
MKDPAHHRHLKPRAGCHSAPLGFLCLVLPQRYRWAPSTIAAHARFVSFLCFQHLRLRHPVPSITLAPAPFSASPIMGACSSVDVVNPHFVDLSHFELMKVVGKGGFGKVRNACFTGTRIARFLMRPSQ